jgi:U5 small nuclear ribonucleoprotein component
MDDLYDEFGNFIGEDAEASEEESQHGVDAGNYVADDDYPEDVPEGPGKDLMEVDGKLFVTTRPRGVGLDLGDR